MDECLLLISSILWLSRWQSRLALHSFISSIFFYGDRGCGFPIHSNAPVFSARYWGGESENISSRACREADSGLLYRLP
jgi:hypothetical protein